jgi:hypothetical protein
MGFCYFDASSSDPRFGLRALAVAEPTSPARLHIESSAARRGGPHVASNDLGAFGPRRLPIDRAGFDPATNDYQLGMTGWVRFAWPGSGTWPGGRALDLPGCPGSPPID